MGGGQRDVPFYVGRFDHCEGGAEALLDLIRSERPETSIHRARWRGIVCHAVGVFQVIALVLGSVKGSILDLP